MYNPFMWEFFKMILTPVLVVAHSLYHHLIVPALSRALHWRLCQRDQCLLKARRSGCWVSWIVWVVDGGNASMMDQNPFENQTLVQPQSSHMGLCVLMATGFREAKSHQQGWAWLHSRNIDYIDECLFFRWVQLEKKIMTNRTGTSKVRSFFSMQENTRYVKAWH